MTAIADYEAGLISLDDLIRRSAEARAAARREHGVVYTPLDLARGMVRMADVRLRDRIWEPSCGHGGFVFPLIEHAIRMCGSVTAAKSWFRDRVLATDLDPDTIRDLKAIVAAFFWREGVASSPDEFGNIRAMDALRDGFDERFTLTIGNPPYVRTRDMDPGLLTDLRGRFPTMRKGNVDIYYAFIERAVNLSERAVLIVPNSCLTASGARALREECFPRLREVADFGAGMPFGDARAYVAVLRFGEPGGRVLVRDGLTGEGREEDWRSLTGEEVRGAPKTALSGIATLADAAFLVREDDGGFVSDITGIRVEPDLVRPLIKATKPGERRHIIHPYRGRAVITEAELASYPGAHAHLLSVRERLLARDRGKTDGYPAWYAYGRSQGLHDLSRPHIIVPAMIGGASLPFLYPGGPALLVSGFAVPESSDPGRSLLSEGFRRFATRTGRERPGAGGYHSISTAHVNSWISRVTGS